MNCPFHPDTEASFTVWEDQPKAHCFGCGWHDDFIQFVHEYRKTPDIMTAVAEICDQLNIPREGIFTYARHPQLYGRGKVRLYGSKCLEEEDFEVIAQSRGLDPKGISAAAPFLRKLFYNCKGYPRRPTLAFADPGLHIAVLRRIDFEPWDNGAKATFAPQSITGWPIGIVEGCAQDRIAVIEGTGDFLGTYSIVDSLGVLDDILPVAVSSASVTIWEPALTLFAGKIIRIFAHRDKPGIDAAKRWKTQLDLVAKRIDIFVVPPVECSNYKTGGSLLAY
jgi:hypothetical protein